MIHTKKKIFSLITFFSLTLPLYAQGIMPRGMTSLAEQILEIFSGRFVQIIFAIFFCGAAVAYGFNKDNEKINKLISVLSHIMRTVVMIFIAPGTGGR
jgi:hypothetical protein